MTNLVHIKMLRMVLRKSAPLQHVMGVAEPSAKLEHLLVATGVRPPLVVRILIILEGVVAGVRHHLLHHGCKTDTSWMQNAHGR